jgi:hypothetical protein
VTGWIVTGVLYVLGMGFFALVGGVAAAGDAIRHWGAASADRRRLPGSSPSA